MGKISKREPVRHSNHHDNSVRPKKHIVRRTYSHSLKAQRPALKNGNKTKSASQGTASVPFARDDIILLIGEGDFSFALSLGQHHPVRHITATSYDSEAELHRKYPQASLNLEQLTRLPTNSALGHNTNANGNDGSEHSFNHDHDGDDAIEGSEWKGLSASSSPSQTADNVSSSLKATPSSSHPSISVLHSISAPHLSTIHRKALLHPITHHAVSSSFTGTASRGYSKIVFNFPHTGGLSTDVNRQVRANQELLAAFFKSAIPLLAPVPAQSSRSNPSCEHDDTDDDDPEVSSSYSPVTSPPFTAPAILVSLFEGAPYSLWNIRDLARHSGLSVLTSFRFPWEAFSGYRHARTVGEIRAKARRGQERRAVDGVGRGVGEAEDGCAKENSGDDGGEVAADNRPGRWRGEERDARMYVFAPKDSDIHRADGDAGRVDVAKGGKGKKRKRRREMDDSSGDDSE